MTDRRNPDPIAPEATKLIIIRGNSGSGKSSIARAVRDRYGRGCALVEQDYLRRILLREWDGRNSGGIAPQFIATTALFALQNGYHVVLDGFLWTERYGNALRDLLAAHAGERYVFYLDVSFDETVRRHATRPQREEFTPEQMREWYEPGDVLGVDGEHVIPESSTFADSVDFIVHTSGLSGPANRVAAQAGTGPEFAA